MKMVMSDFQFDTELDEELFSMELPEGYTLAERTVELKQPSFQDVPVLLGVMAKMNDGQFPDALPSEPSMGAYMKPLKGFDTVLGKDEAMEAVMPMGRGIMFLANEIHPGGHYVGKGVKLGDAESAIFWYRPKDSETYKVVYGDLSIKDVAEEDLPTVPDDDATGPE